MTRFHSLQRRPGRSCRLFVGLAGVLLLVVATGTLRNAGADGDGEVRPDGPPPDPAQAQDPTAPVGARDEIRFRTQLPAVWSVADASDWPDLEWQAAGRTARGETGSITVPKGHVLGVVLHHEATGEQVGQLNLLAEKNLIHRLSLARLAIHDEALATLHDLDGLRELDLSACPDLTAIACDHVGALVKLRRLRMANNHWVTRSGLGSLRRLHRLLALAVADCPGVDDEGLLVLQQMPELQVLDISGCDRVGDASLASVATLRELRELRMIRVRGIGDRGLASLSGMVQLRKLALGPLTRATDRGMNALETLTDLRVLMLADARRITDEGLKNLADMRALDTLSLQGAAITDEGVMATLAPLPELRFIDLRGCGRLTDEGVKSLQQALPDRYVRR